VKPLIGFRVKLQTRGEGKWAMSSGDNAKFGLNTAEILFAVEKLRAAKLQQCLKLVHFHIGSQVPNIITIKNAVTEAARFYCQLAKMGFPMGYLDCGGGLGIDYDGSRTNFESSMNYSMGEYARDVVFNIREICTASGVKVPDIVTESGRAIAAPHSMLVVEVFERINKRESLGHQHQPKTRHKVVDDLEVLLKNKAKLGRLERFHDAVQKKEEAFSLFNLGYLDLENRAAAEQLFWQICEKIDQEGPRPVTSPRNSTTSRSSSPTSTSATSPSSSRSSTTGPSSSSSPSPRCTGSRKSPPSTPSSSTSPATPTARSPASSTCRT
jgi:arginine decarboxylase